MQKFNSFPPIIPLQADVLILGSMPGTRSICRQQYYAHPQNSFWPILAQIYSHYLTLEETELWQQGKHQDLPFERKSALLERAGIALWDVLASCQRQNSSDHSICDTICNPIAELVEKAPIGQILFNGHKSAKLFYQYIHLSSDYIYKVLPSSSPANATMSFQKKLEIWRLALAIKENHQA